MGEIFNFQLLRLIYIAPLVVTSAFEYFFDLICIASAIVIHLV